MSILTILAILIMGALLGLMGGGGSILSVPIFIYLMELAEKEAIATSLLVVGTTSLFSLLIYLYKKQVDVRIGAIFSIFSMIGAFIGGYLAKFVPATVLVLLFAVMMVAASFAMLKGRKQTPENTDAHVPSTKDLPLLKIAAEGIVVGIVTGLVGAGGGFLVVPALVLLSGLPMKRAVATSLMIIVLKSYSAFAGYLSHTTIDFSIAFSVIGLSVLGAIVGVLLGSVVSGDRLRKGFGVFVLMMGVFVLAREIPWEVSPTVTGIAMLIAGGIGVLFSRMMQKSAPTASLPPSKAETQLPTAKP